MVVQRPKYVIKKKSHGIKGGGSSPNLDDLGSSIIMKNSCAR